MKNTVLFDNILSRRITPQMLINAGAFSYEEFQDYVSWIDIKTGSFMVEPPEYIFKVFYCNIKKNIPHLPYAINISFPQFEGTEFIEGEERARLLLNEPINFYGDINDPTHLAAVYIGSNNKNKVGTEISKEAILEYSLKNLNPYIEQINEDIEFYKFLPEKQRNYILKKENFKEKLIIIMDEISLTEDVDFEDRVLILANIIIGSRYAWELIIKHLFKPICTSAIVADFKRFNSEN